MSPFSMSATNRATRRPGARRHRPQLESLERRVALSTVAGREAVPIAALAPVPGSPTPRAALDKIGSPEAIHQQQGNINTVEIQNLLDFNLFVVAHLNGTNSLVAKRLPAKRPSQPGPIQVFRFHQQNPSFIEIDIRKQGGGPPDPRNGVDLIRPSMDGYFNQLYTISIVFKKFSVTKVPPPP